MNDQQARFVEEYLKDLNATRAAKRAGYSEKTAGSQGHDLLKKPEIVEALRVAMEKRSARTEVTQDWVIDRLVKNVDQAMRLVPVLDREGEETGEFTYQGAVANKALELLGKHVGMFTEKVEHSGRVEVDSSDIAQAIERFTGTIVQLAARGRAGLPAGDAAAGGDSPTRLQVARVASET